MINEKKLIESVKAYKELGLGRNLHSIAEVIIEIIESQPKVGEWIPVEERLPKHNGAYLITAINESGGIYMAVAIYDSQYKTFCSSGDGDDDNAIAWQLLPEPYRVPLEKNSKGETE